jgi:hypothetical protein
MRVEINIYQAVGKMIDLDYRGIRQSGKKLSFG